MRKIKKGNKNLAYKGLVIIFGILLIQSSISLFFDSGSGQLTQIDTVFRTAISSIFGFLMSGLVTSKRKKEKTGIIAYDVKVVEVENEKEAHSEEENDSVDNRTQIWSILCVCIFCLVIMIVIRNFSHFIVNSSSTTITIAMYRDIISGSIGALIGASKNG